MCACVRMVEREGRKVFEEAISGSQFPDNSTKEGPEGSSVMHPSP